MNTARSDAENLKALEAIKPTAEKLKAERIRNDADIERFAREFEEAKVAAVEMLGTSDEAEIRTMIEEARTANTEAVDEYVSGVRAVEAQLGELDRGPA